MLAMSEAQIGRCRAEFALRYNSRELTDTEHAIEILRGGIGRRLTYPRVDKLAA